MRLTLCILGEQNASEVEIFSHRELLLFGPAHTMKNDESTTYSLRTQQYEVSGFRPNDVGFAQHAMEVQLRLGVLRRQTRQGHRVLRNDKQSKGNNRAHALHVSRGGRNTPTPPPRGGDRAGDADRVCSNEKILTLYQSHRFRTPRGQTYNAPESEGREDKCEDPPSGGRGGGVGIVRYMFAENSPRPGSSGPSSSTCTNPLLHRVGPLMMRGSPPPNGRLGRRPPCMSPAVLPPPSSRARPAPAGHASSSSSRSLSSGHSR